jgi:transposase
MTVEMTCKELSAAELRNAAARCDDAAMSRRALAMALVLEGKTRMEAARSTGMDRQTLRDWVHRYNELGLEGLRNRANPGAPPRKLTQAQESQLAEWVRRGPALEHHKIVRWRLVDLRDEIAREFGIWMHERTVGKIMARLKFRRISVRPRHPDQDAAAQEAHKKTSPTSSLPPSPSTRVESPSSSGGRMKPGSGSRAA